MLKIALLIFSIFWLDYFTKQMVLSTMLYGESIYITSFFNLVHVKNLGVSFSLFSNKSAYGPYLLVTLQTGVVLFLLSMMFKSTCSKVRLSLCMIIAGALGNIVDRLMHGGVIDFLDFYAMGYHWPAFNVADIFVVLGVGYYFLLSLIADKTVCESQKKE
ncbi:MAG: Lipoprotein signal peptidase [Holosporales bacterium]